MKSKRASGRAKIPQPRVETIARSALKRLVRLAMRCGFENVEETVGEAVREFERESMTVANFAELRAAGNVMTVWYGEPSYIDSSGQPRPLSRSGRKPSFASLVRRVDPQLDVDEVLAYLLASGAVKRRGGRYWPTQQLVVLRGMRGAWDLRELRIVEALLRNAEHNARPPTEVASWLERIAENEEVPVRLIRPFKAFLEEEAMPFLYRIDRWLHNAQLEKHAGEETTWVTVGAYYVEGHASETEHHANGASPRGPKRRRSP